MLKIIEERGYFFQCTDREALEHRLHSGEKLVFYLGFDCTASAIHLGHLVPLMLMRLVKSYGHEVIILLGGGTTLIGDPSGKDKSRKILSREEINRNVDTISKIVKRVVGDVRFVNNVDWLEDIRYIDFLRNVGRHFSINRMLTFDSVKSRLDRESHLSFLEFSYMILQAYDFVELNRLYNCSVQVGGGDQWGNIVNGVELGRKLRNTQLFGLTVPLITTASGKKMGKTEEGAVWLDADLYSPHDYWQYFRNTEDSDVERFLRLFTELPIDEIETLSACDDAQINEAKKVLATEATRICHGSVIAEEVSTSIIKAFEEDDLSQLPEIRVPHGANIIDVVIRIEAASSRTQAKRLIESGAVKIDKKKILTYNLDLPEQFVVSVGKKQRNIIVT
ncbi:tyrosine--tRNA ligase [Neorickettsia sennetsu]|uniref:Tyrosine--tRNA ligase n=1 Tax=Ehrlichia sennetsu (strain ATCC VR-367 / Miyayama) TaxID=222891 RepID=Q2GE62_EHRS3|nr:tyrosine--tRNA ligase [Neorickettsia sennetsu]ABD46181.1 tyrosyl-tRNA synthetase [Neorickettsia sennetsu str. Miyayama]